MGVQAAPVDHAFDTNPLPSEGLCSRSVGEGQDCGYIYQVLRRIERCVPHSSIWPS